MTASLRRISAPACLRPTQNGPRSLSSKGIPGPFAFAYRHTFNSFHVPTNVPVAGTGATPGTSM